MSKFCIIFGEKIDEEKQQELVKANFDDTYKVKDGVWLVRAEGVTTDIKKKVGFDDEGLNGGIVVSVNSIGGFYDRGLWEWADKE